MTATPAFRLAMRREGIFWNAYLAKPNTMEGAKLVGSIMIAPCEQSPELRRAFIEVMKQMLTVGIEEGLGLEVEGFEEQSAPEHERSGHS